MLKPMNKHFLFIILLLLCLLVSRPAEARLTLGVVTGPDEAAGEVTSVLARSLASLLAEKLQEEVVVKELTDSATLISWLDRFAMLDLALLSAKDVQANPGKFLQIGPFDEQGKLNLVSRQGVAGDLPQRLAAIVRESGFVPWRSVEALAPAAKPSPMQALPPAVPEPAAAETVIAAQVELQHVPPLSPGRAWTPQEEGAYRDILPSDEAPAKNLVLGVFPDPRGLVGTAQQAERLIAYLERVLPVSVKLREFTQPETFAEWFMRYRMVDLAVVSPAVAKAMLGRDYLPVAKLFRADQPGIDATALVVMRRGQNEELQVPMQRVLLEMPQAADGPALLAALNIGKVLAAEDVPARPVVVTQEPGPVTEVGKPLLELVGVPAEKLQPSPPEYAEPVEPVAPSEVEVKPLPRLPEVAKPRVIMAEVEMPLALLTLPGAAAAPVEPARPAMPETIKVPDLTVRQAAPQPAPPQPELPPLPTLPTREAPSPSPELTAAVEPVAMPMAPAAPVVEPVPAVAAIELVDIPLPVPEVPVVLVAPPISQEQVLPKPAEAPEAPVAPLLDTVSAQIPEEPVAAPAPPMPPAVVPPTPVTTGQQEPLETAAVAADSAVAELEPPFVAPPVTELEAAPVVNAEAATVKQQDIVEEVLKFAEAVPSYEAAGVIPVTVDENAEAWSDEQFAAVLNEDLVAAVVAQPDIPEELRPSGVPVVRPGRVARRATVSEDQLLLASLPEPLKNVEPPRPPNLLPEPEPEPGVVYIVPFVSIMVPDEVNARVFDQFVDALNRDGEALGLQFVILKEGLQRVSPQWLSIRKYVTGEIYAYVEDSGCCSTDLRTKARLTYYRASQKAPAFGFEYPVKSFFDHDSSTLDVERAKLSDNIAGTLAGELLRALQN